MIINRQSSAPNYVTSAVAQSAASEQLTRNKLLEALPGHEREALWALAEEVEIAKGQLIASAGDPFTKIFFPEDSVFSFVTDLENGSSVESGTVGNEGFVGIPVLLGAEHWGQRTIAQIPGKACMLPAIAFTNLVPTLPVLNMLLDRYLLAYIGQVSQTAACNSQHTVIQRCARWILLTHDRTAARAIPLTQEFLSYMLGVRRPSVTVAQATLQRKGLIKYTRGKLEIVDREGLEKLSCECYFVVRTHFAGLIGAAVG